MKNIFLPTHIQYDCTAFPTNFIDCSAEMFSVCAAYLEDGVLQTDSLKLRQHYINSTTFYIDLLCLLPLDFLYLSLDFQSMLRVCRLVKDPFYITCQITSQNVVVKLS